MGFVAHEACRSVCIDAQCGICCVGDLLKLIACVAIVHVLNSNSEFLAVWVVLQMKYIV